MKRLLLSFTLPLTILSFGLITKWSYGIVIDGTDDFFYGFPFIHKCRGFHTSLSTQYFALELLVNILSYFLFWVIITFLVNKKWPISIPVKITNLFWIGFGVFLAGFIFLSYSLEDRFLVKRDFDVVIFDQGISLFDHHPNREHFTNELNEWFEEKN
ncbi:MAG: hypothetical protein AB8E82_19245 [Aureispira sp.]